MFDTEPEQFEIETYDDNTVNDLINQGWVDVADGIPTEDVAELINSFTEEVRAFRKDDGKCLVLAYMPEEAGETPEESAMGGETPEGAQGSTRDRLENVFPGMFGKDEPRSGGRMAG